MRDVRFGFQFAAARAIEPGRFDPGATARRAEELGFDVFLVADHVGSGRSPLTTLAAVAATTDTIRLGTLVLNSDMRNPVHLAWEATTIDHLSGGRFELGLGAGHTPQEYAATGIVRRSAAERKVALMERVEIVRRLLDGETVTWHGAAHDLDAARIDRSVQERLPIMVAGNGSSLLAHAGRHADSVGLQGLGRTLPDGHRHTVRWTAEWLDEQVGQIRTGAGDRPLPELNALVQVVEITDDPEPVIAGLLGELEGLTAADLAEIPYVLIGTIDEIVDKLHRCRDRWGISYFAVRELESFAPVIAATRNR